MTKIFVSLLILSAVLYQSQGFRRYPQQLSIKRNELEAVPAVAVATDVERTEQAKEIALIQENPELLQLSVTPVKGYDQTGDLEEDLEDINVKQYLDAESEIENFLEMSQDSSIFQKRSAIVGECPKGSTWTPWHSRDRPSGTGDWELKSLYLPKGTCADKRASGIEARLVSNNDPYYMGGNILSIGVNYGLVCQNNKQKKGVRCDDYKIRFCCKPEVDYNEGIVGECPKDGSYWTPWHNRDLPTGNGDWELRSLYQPRDNCAGEDPAPPAIQVRLTATGEPYQMGGDFVHVNPGLGFVCRNNEQKDKRCEDYEVRYCCKKNDFNDGIVGDCPADGEWTPWHNRDAPGGTGDWEVRSLYQPKTKCTHSKLPPMAIQARVSSTQLPYQTGGDVVTVNPIVGLICKNNNQQDGRCNNYEVRYCCGKEEPVDDSIVGRCDLRTSSWTPWDSRDNQYGSGDWEHRSQYRPKGTCVNTNIQPTAIQARLVGTGASYTTSGNVLEYVNAAQGLVCLNKKQPPVGKKMCENFEVRYCCPRRIILPMERNEIRN